MSQSELLDLYSSISNHSQSDEKIGSTIEPMNRINQYIHGTIDKSIGIDQLHNLNNYDAVRNEILNKDGHINGLAMKQRMNGNFSGNPVALGRLLAQTYSYSSESSSSPQGLNVQFSPRQFNGRSSVFSHCEDSPDSVGSAGSRQSFSYSSGSAASGRNRCSGLSGISEPGSPTLDDAILLASQCNTSFGQNYANLNNSKDSSFSDFMTSLSLNSGSYNNSINRHSSSSLSPPSQQQTFLPSNSYIGSNGNFNGNSTIGSPVNNGDLPSLAQLQNSCLASQMFPNLVDYSNLLGVMGELRGNSPLGSDPYAIEKAAKLHRNAAAICEANCTWSGQLPVGVHKNPFYSCKVFLGGVPWDVTESALKQAFMQFGSIQVEWPGKECSANPPKGYVYILFENEKQVKALLANCTQDFSSDNYYFKISSRKMRQKEVQVIPWVLSDSNYVRCPSFQLDPAKTVFVGALHGMLSAEGLANIMNDLFGGVVYSGIDTDKHKYPIGSGRVTFNNSSSYRRAVKAAFIEIKAPKFTKKVQVDPYLADSICQVCTNQQGPYFCRDDGCFKYFCRSCWLLTHPAELKNHKPLMRNSKLRTRANLTSII